MDQCALYIAACQQALLDEFTLLSNIFFAVGALLLQWALIDPHGPKPEPRGRRPEHSRRTFNDEDDND